MGEISIFRADYGYRLKIRGKSLQFGWQNLMKNAEKGQRRQEEGKGRRVVLEDPRIGVCNLCRGIARELERRVG
jgi:hypothetical protein